MKKRLKILRIIARLNIGGPSQNAVFLSEGLNTDDFETLLVTGRITEDEGDMSFLLKDRDIRYVVIPELTRRIDIFKDIVSLCKIFNLVRKEKPDIIHTHTAKAGALGRIAGLLYNLFCCQRHLRLSALHLRKSALLVHTFHGHILEGYFGKFKTQVFLFAERFLAQFTDRIIAVSESVRQDLIKFHIGTKEKIIVIPVGLELEKFLAPSPEPRAPSPDGYFKIGIVGRLVPIKNHKMFLDVARRILSEPRAPSPEPRFLIVGDGELRNRLEDYAKELDIFDKVIFTGWQRDLGSVYKGLDIVCLTSLNEGTPVSLIEAMAFGKPVVATDVGGVRDIVTSNQISDNIRYQICERGVLVRSGDREGFAEAIKLLLENSQLRDKIIKEARQFISVHFSKARLINDMENLYIKLCQRF